MNKVVRQNPVSGYPRKVVSHISRLDNEDYFHFLENNHLHTEISLCAPVSDSGNVVIAKKGQLCIIFGKRRKGEETNFGFLGCQPKIV